MEHSKLHNELLEKAKSYYMTTLVSHGTKLKHMTAGEEIRNLLSNLEIDLEQLQKNAETLRPADGESKRQLTS